MQSRSGEVRPALRLAAAAATLALITLSISIMLSA